MRAPPLKSLLHPRSSRTASKVKETPDDVEAASGQVQARPAHGREHLGPAQIPDQSAFVRTWPAWAAAEEQGLRLRPAAAREAEAERLLRQPHREAVLANLSGRRPAKGQQLR